MAKHASHAHLRFTGLANVLLSMSLAGCGSSHEASPDARAADASQQPSTITVTNGDVAPAFIAFREGNGDWKLPAATATGYELTVNGPYVVVHVCPSVAQRSPFVRFDARTPTDDHALQMFCRSADEPKVTLDAKIVQPGNISFNTTRNHYLGHSNTPDWTQSYSVVLGTYVVVATTVDRIEVRRDIPVSAALSLTPPFDVENRGAALVATPLAVTGAAANEVIKADVEVKTTLGSYALVTAKPDAVKVVPPALLAASDVQRIKVSVQTGTFGRSLSRIWQPGGSTDFVLPAALNPVEYTVNDQKLVASTTLPAFDRVNIFISQRPPASSALVSAFFSKSYLDAVGEMAIDLAIPGFLDAWRPDLTKEYIRTLSVARSTMTEDTQQFVIETVNAGQ